MRLFRFLVIFLVFSFIFAACSSGDEEIELDDGKNESENKSDDGNGNENGSKEEPEQNSKCGNNIVDTGEICDGGIQECQIINSNYVSGTATCKADCSDWDVSNCLTASNDNEGNGNNDENGNGNQNAGFDKNSKGIWVDPDTYLIWENPMSNKGVGGTGVAHANAINYCENLVLAGADDWRMPTIDELRTLIRGVSTTMTDGKCPTSELCPNQDNCNKNNDGKHEYGYSCLGCNALDDPNKQEQSFLTEEDCLLSDRQIENGEIYIVPEMFGDPHRLWSSTKNTSAAGSLTQAFWYVNYSNGYIGSDMASNGTHWVRCVRTGTADDIPEHEAGVEHDPSWECIVEADCPEGKWCEKNECVIKPAETYTAANGLEWQADRVPKAVSWDGAKKYCDDLELAGKSDWRLPNIDELKSLVTGCAKTNECAVSVEKPGYNESYLPTQASCKGCGSGNYMPQEVGQQIDFSYWTSTNDPGKTNRVWAINFMNGEVFYSYDTANHYARCVRGTIN